jgi:hypothetical protein
MKVSDIFETHPGHWGLRGDPHLWQELQSRLNDTAMPATPEDLQILLIRAFEEAVGVPVTHGEFVVVDRFRHGGMSSGGISPEFWRLKAIPLLVSRHPGANSNPKSSHSNDKTNH